MPSHTLIYTPMPMMLILLCFNFLTSHSNSGAATKLLIDAGAKVNAKHASGTTALSVAAAMGHCNVIKALLDSPDTDINCQVNVLSVCL